MKKILSISIVVSMLFLCACNNKNPSSSENVNEMASDITSSSLQEDVIEEQSQEELTVAFEETSAIEESSIEISEEDLIDYSLDKLKEAYNKYNSSVVTHSIANDTIVFSMVGDKEGNAYCATVRNDTGETYVTKISTDGYYYISDKNGNIYVCEGTASEKVFSEWWYSFIDLAGNGDKCFEKANFKEILSKIGDSDLSYERDYEENQDGMAEEIIKVLFEYSDISYEYRVDLKENKLVQFKAKLSDDTEVISSSIVIAEFPNVYTDIATDEVLVNLKGCTDYVDAELFRIWNKN